MAICLFRRWKGWIYLEHQRSCVLYLWISLVSNLRVWLVLPLYMNMWDLRFLKTVHHSFKCFLTFNPQIVMTCSPQPSDICGTLHIGDLKLLSVHIFPLFLCPYSLFFVWFCLRMSRFDLFIPTEAFNGGQANSDSVVWLPGCVIQAE